MKAPPVRGSIVPSSIPLGGCPITCLSTLPRKRPPPMLQYDFEQSIGCWIVGTAHVMSKALNEELAVHNITQRQWEVLCWLSYHGEQSQSMLAENMRIEAPTLVGVLDRMERDGWIERVADPNDRRRKLIQPTEQVEPVWAKMVECAQRVRERATAGLSQEQKASLRDMLQQVRENLGAEPCTARGGNNKSACGEATTAPAASPAVEEVGSEA